MANTNVTKIEYCRLASQMGPIQVLVFISVLVLNLTDDIIRLNKKEQQLKRRQASVNRRPVKKKKGRLIQGRGVSTKTGGAVLRGGC